MNCLHCGKRDEEGHRCPRNYRPYGGMWDPASLYNPRMELIPRTVKRFDLAAAAHYSEGICANQKPVTAASMRG